MKDEGGQGSVWAGVRGVGVLARIIRVYVVGSRVLNTWEVPK